MVRLRKLIKLTSLKKLMEFTEKAPRIPRPLCKVEKQ